MAMPNSLQTNNPLSVKRNPLDCLFTYKTRALSNKASVQPLFQLDHVIYFLVLRNNIKMKAYIVHIFACRDPIALTLLSKW